MAPHPGDLGLTATNLAARAYNGGVMGSGKVQKNVTKQ